MSRTIKARAFLPQQSYKNSNNIKRFYIENSPLDKTVNQVNVPLCSTQSNNGLWAKTCEKYILLQFPKSPVQPTTFEFCQAPNLHCELLSMATLFFARVPAKKNAGYANPSHDYNIQSVLLPPTGWHLFPSHHRKVCTGVRYVMTKFSYPWCSAGKKVNLTGFHRFSV